MTTPPAGGEGGHHSGGRAKPPDDGQKLDRPVPATIARTYNETRHRVRTAAGDNQNIGDAVEGRLDNRAIEGGAGMHHNETTLHGGVLPADDPDPPELEQERYFSGSESYTGDMGSHPTEGRRPPSLHSRRGHAETNLRPE